MRQVIDPSCQVPVGDPLQQFARGYEDYLQVYTWSLAT